jgi:hypothetical protein
LIHAYTLKGVVSRKGIMEKVFCITEENEEFIIFLINDFTAIFFNITNGIDGLFMSFSMFHGHSLRYSIFLKAIFKYSLFADNDCDSDIEVLLLPSQ